MSLVIWLLCAFLAIIAILSTIISRIAMLQDIETRKLMYSAPHERRLVSLAEFPRIDPAHYFAVETELWKLGFRAVADIEDMTLAQTSMNPNAPIRCMISADGTTVATFIYLQFSWWIQLFSWLIAGHKNPYLVTFESQFANGAYLVLQLSVAKIADNEPPEVTQVTMDPETSYYDAYQAFLTLRASRPDLVPEQYRGLNDILDSSVRIDHLRHDFRKRMGLVLVEDITRQGMSVEQARKYIARVNKQLRDDPEWGETAGGWRQ